MSDKDASDKSQTLVDFLSELDLENYTEIFEENAIDINLLKTITNDDLKDIGISVLGHRKKLLAAIQKRWNISDNKQTAGDIGKNNTRQVIQVFDGKIENHNVNITSEILKIDTDIYGVISSSAYTIADLVSIQHKVQPPSKIPFTEEKQKTNWKTENKRRAQKLLLFGSIILVLITVMPRWISPWSLMGPHAYFLIIFRLSSVLKIAGTCLLIIGFFKLFRSIPEEIMSGKNVLVANIQDQENTLLTCKNKKEISRLKEILSSVQNYIATGVVPSITSGRPESWTARGGSEPMFFLGIFLIVVGFSTALSVSSFGSPGIVFLGIIIILPVFFLGFRQKSLALLFFAASDIVILINYFLDVS